MPQPQYKYSIGFEGYDCEVIDGGYHYSGGGYLALLEFDGSDWIEVDRWFTDGKELVQEIIWIEESIGPNKYETSSR